ncbi:KptA family-domain-containing protein [Russula earlei]|uniref:KptA family-domain-containing protein n=1 Tax=Russula earlei TaxID=71964 RepID=A0ACC0U8Z0_9AGAM|nr:KptA family-domain-containing protein [Russula earlei]
MNNPPKQKGSRPTPGPGGRTPLRGHPKESPQVRLSKTLSWILRHGAKSEGLSMRPDGYVRVSDLLASPRFSSPTQLDLAALQRIVESDSKQRYMLIKAPNEAAPMADEVWWIRANQGHSLKEVKLDLKPILSAADIPMAVHGTTKTAWESISVQGLSRRTRNHIHLAQGVPEDGVISGMRKLSQVLIYIDVQKALDAGIPFFISENGVVLTEGDGSGFLSPKYFLRVEDRDGKPIPSWPISSTRTQSGSVVVPSQVS